MGNNNAVSPPRAKKNPIKSLMIFVLFILLLLILFFEGYLIYESAFKDKSTDRLGSSEQIIDDFEFGGDNKHQEPTKENSVRIQTPTGVHVDNNGFAKVPIKNSSSLPVYAIVMYNEEEVYKSSVALEPGQTTLATIEFGKELSTNQYTVKLQPEQKGHIGVSVKGNLFTD